MPERTFAWFPVTFEVPDQNIMWIGEAARYDDDEKIVYIDDGYQARTFFVGAVDILNENEMRWRSLANDEPMRIRPTVAGDAARWNYPGSLRIPLPTEIIGALMTNTIPPPTLAAAVDDQGDVHTMILETGMGLYARYSASWIRMTDISPIEQLDIVDVPDERSGHLRPGRPAGRHRQHPVPAPAQLAQPVRRRNDPAAGADRGQRRADRRRWRRSPTCPTPSSTPGEH